MKLRKITIHATLSGTSTQIRRNVEELFLERLESPQQLERIEVLTYEKNRKIGTVSTTTGFLGYKTKPVQNKPKKSKKSKSKK